MKSRARTSFFLIPFAVVLLIIAVWLGKTALEHKGFFAYHYSLITSKTYSSYQDELIDLTREDPKLAFARYREILEGDPLSYNTCHGIAHQMGHVAFTTFGFQKAMTDQDGLCGAGYIHGIVEARFGLLQEKDIIAELPTICDVGSKNCYHGIGHGLMVATKLNIQQSLTYCYALPALGRRNCYDGVWMHIFDLEESGAPHEQMNAFVIPDATLVAQRVALCAKTGDVYKTSCYFYLPRIYAHATETAFSHFETLCTGVEASSRVVCAAGVGHTSMKYHIAEPQVSIDKCLGFRTGELASACKEGGFLYYLFAAESASDATSTCEAFTNEKDKALCKKVGQYRGDL